MSESSAPIRPAGVSFDLPKLQEALKQVLSRYAFHPHAYQIGLTHSERAHSPEEKIYDAAGAIWDRAKNVYLRQESEFTIFNRDFIDSYFYEVYRKVSEWSPLSIGRVRLMLRPSGSCYKMHWDDDLRYHLAIVTNDYSYFLYKNGRTYRIPADGQLYHFDARTHHTGLNAGFTDRVHLVFSTY